LNRDRDAAAVEAESTGQEAISETTSRTAGAAKDGPAGDVHGEITTRITGPKRPEQEYANDTK